MGYNFPSSPTEAQEFTPPGGVTYVYYTPVWKVKPVASGGGGSAIFIGETAPSTPVEGQTWWQPSTGKSFIWYEDEWIRLSTGDPWVEPVLEDGLYLDFTAGTAKVMDSVGTKDYDGSVHNLLTYTAPSPKWIYNVAGVLGYAPHNLLLQSQAFDDATWSKDGLTVTANAVAAPDGTMTADKLVESAANAEHRTYVSTGVAAGPATATFYAKAAGRSWVALRFSTNAAANFNLATGVVGTINATYTLSASMQPVGNGWYRCTMSFTSAGGLWFIITLGDADGGTGAAYPYPGDGTSGVYCWGAQLEQNATPSAYVATTTAARYGIPLDHDPVSHAPLGVLVEEQRTNLLTYSHDFANAVWNVYGLAQAAGTTAAPDGVGTMRKITAAVAYTDHILYSAVTGEGATNTVSIYAKKGTWNFVYMSFQGSSAYGTVVFDLNAGTVGQIATLAWAAPTAGIQHIGNGIYRCWMTQAASDITWLNMGHAGAATGNTIDGLGRPTFYTSGTEAYEIWGAQVEVGAFPTSYIPTTTAQVTRAGDKISLPVAAFPYNDAVGTWAAEFAFPAYVAGVDWRVLGATSTPMYRVSATAVSTFDGTGAVVYGGALNADKTSNKAAMGYSSTTVSGSLNGAAVGTGAFDGGWSATAMYFLSDAARQSNGYIKTVTYYPVRKTNAELQTMSTP